MFRRYSGNRNSKPGVLIVAASVPVLGASPGAGATGAWVLGGASRCSGSLGRGLGAGAVFAGLGFDLGGGFTGAGFSTGGVGSASGATRCFGAGAGAATRLTAYAGGLGLGSSRTVANSSSAMPAWITTVPAIP